MSERTMKTGAMPEEAAALIAALRSLMDLEDGELYTLRKGMFHRVSRNEDDNGLRRIKIMEEAYDAAARVAKRLRPRMRGYRPDPALVISAFVQYAARLEDAEDIALDYLQWVFSRREPAADSKSVPDGQRQTALSVADESTHPSEERRQLVRGTEVAGTAGHER